MNVIACALVNLHVVYYVTLCVLCVCGSVTTYFDHTSTLFAVNDGQVFALHMSAVQIYPNILGLKLVLAPHLSRSNHHLFPIQSFSPRIQSSE